jgi:hypothetical protein
MSGLTHTSGVVGTTVLGTKIVNGTLPFTGAAVGLYVVIAAVLLATGAVFTLLGRRNARA